MMFPLGLQVKGPSNPGKLSEVADKVGAVPAEDAYILTCRLE